MIPQLPFADLVARAAEILREEGASEVYVFGSVARAAAKQDSDLDLAVAGLPADRMVRAISRLVSETGKLVDLVQVEREPALVRYLQSKGELRRVA
jgi:predicted nucleotidyltransferase